MLRTVVAGLLAVGMLMLMPAKNMAEVPDFVNYSGRLTDGTAWGQSNLRYSHSLLGLVGVLPRASTLHRGWRGA